MPVTLKELAVRAGVHPSTISRVANNDPGLRIAVGTRARIESLLRETGYRPDGVARGLKLRQTFVLAMLIPDVTNPLFAAIFRGVEDAAGLRSFSVILCNTDGSPERQRSHLLTLQARRVDGVIVASAYLRDPAVRWLRREGIPHVLVNRYSDTRDLFVGSDDVAGGRAATEHLVRLGHRRIGHLAGPETVSTAVLRRRGYLAALVAAGLEADPALVVESGLMEAGGVEAAGRLLDLPRPPTAIFAVNDMAAIGAYEAAQRRGLAIPRDVSVAGYNDVPLAHRVQPALTTMRVPAHEFGRASAEMLIAQVEGASGRPGRVVFQAELIERDSSRSPGAAADRPRNGGRLRPVPVDSAE